MEQFFYGLCFGIGAVCLALLLSWLLLYLLVVVFSKILTLYYGPKVVTCLVQLGNAAKTELEALPPITRAATKKLMEAVPSDLIGVFRRWL